MSTFNRQVVLRKRPEGTVGSEHFAVIENPVPESAPASG